MKISDNYVIKQIADEYILVPIGQGVVDCKQLLNLNETGLFICKCLEKDMSHKELLQKFYQEFEETGIDKYILKQDMELFVYKARELGVIEGE